MTSAVVGFDWAHIPSAWPSVRIESLVSHVDDPSTSGLEQLHMLSKERGVLPRDHGSQGFSEADSYVGYKKFHSGDIIMNKMQAWNGVFGLASSSGIVSPDYATFRPDPHTIDARFLVYLLKDPIYAGIFSGISRGMGTGFNRVHPEQFLKVPVSIPKLEDQRRIADFLDSETARIGNLIRLQEQIMEKLDERETAQLDSVIDELTDRWGTVPLRRFLRGVDQGTSPQAEAFPAAADEWGVLKVSCLRPGRFIPQENKRLPSNIEPDVKNEVRTGDLLITRANTPQLVGSAAVVPRGRGKLLLSDKIFRVHLDQSIMAEYVATVARGSRIRDLCAASSNGASQSMANIRFEEVKAWPVPAVGLDAQYDVVRRVDRQRSALDELRTKIKRQVLLLTERRQALITAAVTGQFDVTTASGRNVTEGVTV